MAGHGDGGRLTMALHSSQRHPRRLLVPALVFQLAINA
jgi:hypothetical protein